MKQKFQAGLVGLLLAVAIATGIAIVATFILPKSFKKSISPEQLIAPSPKSNLTSNGSAATPAPSGADETATEDVQILNFLPDWAPKIQWGPTKESSNFTLSDLNVGKPIPGFSRQGIFIAKNLAEVNRIVEGFEDKTLLSKLGWQTDDSLNAFGVEGRSWGYVKIKDRTEKILFFKH